MITSESAVFEEQVKFFLSHAPEKVICFRDMHFFYFKTIPSASRIVMSCRPTDRYSRSQYFRKTGS